MSVQRFRTSPHDAAKLSYARAIFQGIQAVNAVLKDGEIAEIEERLAALEQQKEHEKSHRSRY
jgi:hypothetical protein